MFVFGRDLVAEQLNPIVQYYDKQFRFDFVEPYWTSRHECTYRLKPTDTYQPSLKKKKKELTCWVKLKQFSIFTYQSLVLVDLSTYFTRKVRRRHIANLKNSLVGLSVILDTSPPPKFPVPPSVCLKLYNSRVQSATDSSLYLND